MNEEPIVRDFALAATKAWPLQEAFRLLDSRLRGRTPSKGYVLFETGYGPSGLPHIGTFGEVVRTNMVRQAFHQLAPHIPTHLLVFSDDMDGLRKVPENIPNREMLAQHLDKPLTSIPDPFGTHESFGHHNNACLCQFLDSLSFEYTLASATEYYRSGKFDAVLLTVLQHYDAIMSIILPTLRQERHITYAPFLPICPRTKRVLQVPILFHDVVAGTIVYQDPNNRGKVEVPVTGGHCKLQWKVDWGMRWHALEVDYEMSGKDLLDSVKLSDQVCHILGSEPPLNLTYELFLDEKRQKISKSKGNGLSIEEWLHYAPIESLALFMYQKPKVAKRLCLDIIPRTIDEYIQLSEEFLTQAKADQLANPVWHIHAGCPPSANIPVSFSMLLNLISACHSTDKEVIWHYVSRYVKDMTPDTVLLLKRLIEYAITYAGDFVLPRRYYRLPSTEEKEALIDLRSSLESILGEIPVVADNIQALLYKVGKRYSTLGDLRTWFKLLYQLLLGQEEGPRMGTFIALYGIKETIELIDELLSKKANIAFDS